MTATRRRTMSAITDDTRSNRPSNQLYSTVTFWPSTQPASVRPLRNALARRTEASADLRLTRATTGNGGCCARATSGHVVETAIPLMKSRRRITHPEAPGPHIVAGQTCRPEGVEVWLSMSALGHKQTFRSVRAMSALPPKADIAHFIGPRPLSYRAAPNQARDRPSAGLVRDSCVASLVDQLLLGRFDLRFRGLQRVPRRASRPSR